MLVDKRKAPNFFQLQRWIERLWIESWGVALFLLLGYALHERADATFRLEYTKLYEILSTLGEERTQAIEKRDEYRQQIESQNDPQFLQLTLMRKLGAAPKGYQKVYFREKPNESAKLKPSL